MTAIAHWRPRSRHFHRIFVNLPLIPKLVDDPLMSENFVKRIFIISVTFLLATMVFGYGLAVGRFHVWPYDVIHSSLNCPHSLATWLVRLSVFPALQNRPFLA